MREGAVWVTQASTSPACSFRSHIFEYNGRDSGFILRLLSVLSIRSLSLSLTFPRANTCSDLITFPSSWNQAPRCPEDLWLCPESLVVDRPRVPRPPIPSSFIARPHEGKRCPMVQGLSWWHRRRQRALSPSRSSSQVTLWSYISPGLSGKLVLYFPSRGHLTGFQRTSSVCERFGLLSDPILLRSLPPSLPSVIQRFLSKALKWPPVRTSWYILIWGPRCPGVSLGDQGEKKFTSSATFIPFVDGGKSMVIPKPPVMVFSGWQWKFSKDFSTWHWRKEGERENIKLALLFDEVFTLGGGGLFILLLRKGACMLMVA